MGLVLVAGAATRGSRRWIDIGFFRSSRPSSARSRSCSRRRRSSPTARSAIDLRGPAQAIIYALRPIAARLRPARLRHGARLRRRARGGALRRRRALAAPRRPRRGRGGRVADGALGASVAGVNVLKPYQTARLTGFTHPRTTRGATRTTCASRSPPSAPAACAVAGRGATQTRLNYLPAHSTDFAFASLAEEHGFFGAAILLLLYLLVVWRALKVVERSRATSSAPSSPVRSRSCSCSRSS